MIFTILAALILPIIVYFTLEYINHLLELKKYPPGPFPLPIIGNLNLLGKRPFEDLQKLHEIYGDPFSMSFGMQRSVVISKITTAREALITKASHFSGRPSNQYTWEVYSRGYKDIAFADYGPTWKYLRKLGHASLKMYGEGLGRLEGLIVKESEELHKRMNEYNQSLDPQYEFGK